MIRVIKIVHQKDLQEAFSIREKVFVIGQNVAKEDEYDEHEAISTHFLCFYGDEPCGTARWRITEKGIKLERFAVLEDYRGKGIGSALVQSVLEDIKRSPSKDQLKYLHAQLSAVALYEKFGFVKEGDVFEECGILHYKMIKK